ncbi:MULTISPECIES: hypothetical protein [Okeania]|uniref:hypothetical protein n=1 Tax=Okeania TaxID=1458928 RepID=UPI0013750D4D|nr:MULTISPECIES: hypothetical protein [Okeania]NET11706.1 hypothetical protein [Okeania sp. SIO1H6]NES74830.1 hypothetical protein [Okeania sp. SIO1H4]NET18979.1 hypothetical protein [Okeania sp. SIO1H5]NET76530.1 hypothetical protein [Okeania sp. SIO1F9]NET93362.1 hypothetical protein [Okeania sp. SIO1H2]
MCCVCRLAIASLIVRVCAQKSFSRGRRQETGDRRQEERGSIEEVVGKIIP